MSKVLTQEEMDALLNHINEDISDSNNSEEKTYVRFDFRKRRSLILDFTDLEYYASKFADDIKKVLSGFFVKNIKVKLTSVKSMSLKEIKETLQFPSGIGYCNLIEKDKKFLIIIDDTTAFAFVELFFGGTSISEKKFEARPFTVIEQRVVRKIYKEIVLSLKSRFIEFFNSNGEFVSLEMVPKHVNIYDNRERLAVFEMEISMDDFGGSMFFLEDVAGKMYLIFPVEVFSRGEKNTDNAFSTSRNQEELNEKILDPLLQVNVDVKVVLGKVEMPISEILNLKKEEVIILDKNIDHELDILIEGIPKFKGIHGISKGAHAVKITKKL